MGAHCCPLSGAKCAACATDPCAAIARVTEFDLFARFIDAVSLHSILFGISKPSPTRRSQPFLWICSAPLPQFGGLVRQPFRCGVYPLAGLLSIALGQALCVGSPISAVVGRNFGLVLGAISSPVSAVLGKVFVDHLRRNFTRSPVTRPAPASRPQPARPNGPNRHRRGR